MNDYYTVYARIVLKDYPVHWGSMDAFRKEFKNIYRENIGNICTLIEAALSVNENRHPPALASAPHFRGLKTDVWEVTPVLQVDKSSDIMLEVKFECHNTQVDYGYTVETVGKKTGERKIYRGVVGNLAARRLSTRGGVGRNHKRNWDEQSYVLPKLEGKNQRKYGSWKNRTIRRYAQITPEHNLRGYTVGDVGYSKQTARRLMIWDKRGNRYIYPDSVDINGPGHQTYRDAVEAAVEKGIKLGFAECLGTQIY